MTWDRTTNMNQNVAAISADFHTHPRYQDFYSLFGSRMGGFTGIMDHCISMAEVLTDWEAAQIKSGYVSAYDETGVDWIVAVEHYVDWMIIQSIADGEVAPERILNAVIAKVKKL